VENQRFENALPHRRCECKRKLIIKHWRRLGPMFGLRIRRVSAEKFPLPSPPKFEIWGRRRGTHCLREFQYLTHGFRVYTVDFLDFNI